MRLRSLIALALPAVLLAGCGDGPAEDDDRTASGEVLEGTASDAMIPLEQVRSQPPLARDRATAEAAAEGAEDPGAEAAGDEGPGDNPLYTDDGTPL